MIESPLYESNAQFEDDEARLVQQSLLPGEPLTSDSFEIAYRFWPYSGVGGDFADFFTLSNGQAGLYVGDVVGKGLPAAMYATLVTGTLRGIHKSGANSASVLALLNRRLMVRPVPGRYCATLYALFDPVSRRLTFSNAGLPYPVLASKSGCVTLMGGGIPSGMFPDSAYDSCSVELSPGDAVLFATDGLHEIRDDRDNDFSWGRLAEIWQECRCKSAEESLDLLFQGAVKFSEKAPHPHDDITAVVLKIKS